MSFPPVNRNYLFFFLDTSLWKADIILCAPKDMILWNNDHNPSHIFAIINFEGNHCSLWQNTTLVVKMSILLRPSFLMTCSLLKKKKKRRIKSRSSRRNLFGVLSFKYTGEQLDHPVWPNFLTLVLSCQLSTIINRVQILERKRKEIHPRAVKIVSIQ